jgi:diguanylate cyclase (GGDEF)-like protein
MPALATAFAQLAIHAAVLGAAFLLVYYSAALPASLAGLKTYGPYFVFAVSAAVAIAFNRGRALLALIVLIAAYAAQQQWLAEGLTTSTARAVYAGLALFVPLNLGLLAMLPERGVFNRYSASRALVLAVQAALIGWVIAAGGTGIIDRAYQTFIDWPALRAGHLPQSGIAALTAGALLASTATFLRHSAIGASLVGALAAWGVAAHIVTASTTFSIFTAAAQLMVTVGVLQDTFRMAFRDELTGLPSRRALNERLMSLPRTYTVAMIDVDHFKSFNDTYGHDLGDQVLKMVAAHIDRVGGGGKAFRYGGEEFTVLFPGKDADEALPCLEDLRADIEDYRLALRAADRPRKSRGGKRQPGGWRDRNSVSVTVSIGVAEPGEGQATPEAVIQAADRALYRAKDRGRNRVSR